MAHGKCRFYIGVMLLYIMQCSHQCSHQLMQTPVGYVTDDVPIINWWLSSPFPAHAHSAGQNFTCSTHSQNQTSALVLGLSSVHTMFGLQCLCFTFFDELFNMQKDAVRSDPFPCRLPLYSFQLCEFSSRVYYSVS